MPGLVVVLGPERGDPIVLRGTGVALWRALDRPQSTDELAISLAEEFDASPDAVRSDIEPVLEQTFRRGRITRSLMIGSVATDMHAPDRRVRPAGNNTRVPAGRPR